MDPWEWYRRGKERALDALEAGEITRQEALDTLQIWVEENEETLPD